MKYKWIMGKGLYHEGLGFMLLGITLIISGICSLFIIGDTFFWSYICGGIIGLGILLTWFGAESVDYALKFYRTEIKKPFNKK